MAKDPAISSRWQLEEETLEIIRRRRPDLKNKTLEECREILQAQYPRKAAKKPARPKRRTDGAR